MPIAQMELLLNSNLQLTLQAFSVARIVCGTVWNVSGLAWADLQAFGAVAQTLHLGPGPGLQARPLGLLAQRKGRRNPTCNPSESEGLHVSFFKEFEGLQVGLRPSATCGKVPPPPAPPLPSAQQAMPSAARRPPHPPLPDWFALPPPRGPRCSSFPYITRTARPHSSLSPLAGPARRLLTAGWRARNQKKAL